ncbi:hypothetical protein VTO42DRAFT_7014 [Malbranchea cinnamomea]
MAEAETISITICGDGGCGKSSITLRLVRSEWTSEYDPTIEDSYSVTRTVDGLPYFLALTDTAGQEEYRGMWASANLKSDAFLLVYDITNASTLETLDYFMEMIDIEAEQRRETNARLIKEHGKTNAKSGKPVAVGMPPPVKFVVGNKCDLKDLRVVSAQQGLEWARKRGCGFMETSAREMVNIEETFALIVRRVVEARRQHFLEQFPHFQNQSPLSVRSSSQHFFPPGLLDSAQVISHSRTPALTAEERQLAQDADGGGSSSHEQYQRKWSGLGRALSKRVARLRQRSATALRGSEASNDASEKPSKRSKSVSHEKHCQPFHDDTTKQLIDVPINASWWRRILCT